MFLSQPRVLVLVKRSGLDYYMLPVPVDQVSVCGGVVWSGGVSVVWCGGAIFLDFLFFVAIISGTVL